MQLFAFDLALPNEPALPTWVLVMAITAIALLFVICLIWLILRQATKNRELSHLERMKALEMGRPIGPSEAEKCQSKYLHNVFWICFWIGAGVPIAATSAASSVMIQTKPQDFSIILAICICVAAISVASVICATVLMISGRYGSAKAGERGSESGDRKINSLD
jgi:hypothetical protein